METEMDKEEAKEVNFLSPEEITTILKNMKPKIETEEEAKSSKKAPNKYKFSPNELNSDIYNLFKNLYKTSLELNDNKLLYDRFEDIILTLKQKGYYIPKEKFITDENLKLITSRNETVKKLIAPPVKQEPDSEPQPITTINFIPDYISLFNKLCWSGINLTDKENLLLNSSLRNLSIQQPNGNVSFFGKIFGKEKDYYIAEVSEVEPPENFNYDNDMEKRKEDGVNEKVYYITNDLCSNWIELPDIKPKQIQQARNIRYIFTGDPEREIVSNPPFNGKEKHFLRCQIARIYHGSKMTPSVNHYVVGDKETPYKKLENNPDKFPPFTFNDVKNINNWIHYPPTILKCGRVSHIIEPPENVDPEEYKNKVIAADPFGERIQSAKKDKELIIGNRTKGKTVKICPWSIKQNYDQNYYINPYIKVLQEGDDGFDPDNIKDNKVSYISICLKSLRWPGAYNFFVNGESYFFYFGFGLKYQEENTDSYCFKQFPTIPKEIPDREEQPEPHEPAKPKVAGGEPGQPEQQEQPPEENKGE